MRTNKLLWPGHISMIENDLKKYSQSFMSNTKWRKLFSAVNEHTVEMTHCVWKMVNEKDPVNGFLPDEKMMGEYYVGDCGALNGPFEFSIIEWVEIPEKYGYRRYKNAPLSYRTHDLKEVERLINLAGNFEYELTNSSLRIYGYKP